MENIYSDLYKKAHSLVHEESDLIANYANLSSLLYWELNPLKNNSINWLGFYRVDESGKGLVLGPFQGKIACIRIPFGRGVCGSTCVKKETIIVKDVHEFEGHIACDDASQSEIVIPIFDQDKKLIGVLDIDSSQKNSFDDQDKIGLEKIVSLFAEKFEYKQSSGIKHAHIN